VLDNEPSKQGAECRSEEGPWEIPAEDTGPLGGLEHVGDGASTIGDGHAWRDKSAFKSYARRETDITHFRKSQLESSQ
jgi:hypothetical protein